MKQANSRNYNWKSIGACIAVALLSFLVAKPDFFKNKGSEYYHISHVEALSASNSSKPQEFLVISNDAGKSSAISVGSETNQRISVKRFNGRKEISSSQVETSFSENMVSVNGEILALRSTSGEAFLLKDKNSYELLSDELPNILKLENDFIHTDSHTVSKLKSPINPQNPSSQGIREIEVLFLVPEDFAGEADDLTVASEVLRSVFLSNHFFLPLNLRLEAKGIIIYEGDSVFSNSIRSRDPYGMLSQGVSEGQKIASPSRDIVAVLSKTFFPTASGLAYMESSCVNPKYSVLFATTGGGKGSVAEKNLAITLAHEVGHVIGMDHDNTRYSSGYSLMSSSFIANPFAISDHSVAQQERFSGVGQDGGECLGFVESGDADGDGVSDLDEDFHGSDWLDSGSHLQEDENFTIVPWNTYLKQLTVAESQIYTRSDSASLFSRQDQSSLITSEVFTSDGKSVYQAGVNMFVGNQFDFLFTDFFNQNPNQYGYIKVVGDPLLAGGGISYGIENVFQNFTHITPQEVDIFDQEEQVYALFNVNVPGSFTKVTRVRNWLTLINLSSSPTRFLLESHSENGSLIRERSVDVPAQGRVDVAADLPSTHLSVGTETIKVSEPKAGEKFAAYINRYYLDVNNSIVSKVQSKAMLGTGAPKYNASVLSLNESNSQKWLEVSNVILNEVTFTLEFRNKINELILSKSFLLSPRSQIHIPLDISSEGVYKIKSNVRNSLAVSGFDYRTSAGIEDVLNIPFSEALRSVKVGRVNTYFDSKNTLVLSNPDTIPGALTCYYNNGSVQLGNVEADNSTVHSIDIDSLFNKIPKNQYGSMFCEFRDSENQLIPITAKLNRELSSGHLVVQNLK